MSRFEPSTLRKVAWSIGAPSVVLVLGALVIEFVDRNAGLPPDLRNWSLDEVLNLVASLAVPLIGLVLAIRLPRNAIGWLFLVAGVGLSLSSFGQQYAIHALRVDPGSWPAPNLMAWLSKWVWPISETMLILLLLTFPDGHLRSRRWRPVAWLAVAAGGALMIATLVVATATWNDPLSRDPFQVQGAARVLVTGSFLFAIVAWPASLIASFVSVFLRFRGSAGEARLQLKWFVVAAGFVAATFALQMLMGDQVVTWVSILSTLSLLFLYAAIAVAVLKYRLYEIDVVIGKTVVFTLLATFITAVYVALVVGVGTVVGNSRSPLLSAIAAAVVAVAFQPVRERARRVANRVVYGRRATPYEVLSVFTERAAETYSTEDVLPRLVQVLAEGMGASEARVWLALGNELRPAAAWPPNGAVPPIRREGRDELPPFPDRERAFPVRHGGELLGAISVVTAPSDPLGPDRERLAEDVAAQTGLLLRNVRLIEELRESRRRIVAAQDERAKVLERNIHDGAQQQLVALAVKQRLVESFVDRDPAKAKAMLGEIQTETQDALETLRDLARGIYPPLLAEKGLAAALTGQARKASVPVDVQATGVSRHWPDVEAAVYFCCLEALQNVAKYANASRAWIRLSERDGLLTFEVGDDGSGFDRSTTSFGTGLQGMADRMDAIGGTVRVESAPGEGTTVVGTILDSSFAPATRPAPGDASRAT